MTDLGTLGGIRSTAFASNTARQVVGGSTTAGSDRFLAVLWENDVITELGTFRGAESFADSINTSGQVVGYGVISDNISWHAFVWEDGVMTDLNDVIPADAGWRLSRAADINDTGQIVSNGLLDGGSTPRAFLLTPVSPAP